MVPVGVSCADKLCSPVLVERVLSRPSFYYLTRFINMLADPLLSTSELRDIAHHIILVVR